MRYYKVPEDELKRLIANNIRAEAYRQAVQDDMDNYLNTLNAIVLRYFPKKNVNDILVRDCVNIELERFEEIVENGTDYYK